MSIATHGNTKEDRQRPATRASVVHNGDQRRQTHPMKHQGWTGQSLTQRPTPRNEQARNATQRGQATPDSPEVTPGADRPTPDSTPQTMQRMHTAIQRTRCCGACTTDDPTRGLLTACPTTGCPQGPTPRENVQWEQAIHDVATHNGMRGGQAKARHHAPSHTARMQGPLQPHTATVQGRTLPKKNPYQGWWSG